jgi:hypothetical protein
MTQQRVVGNAIRLAMRSGLLAKQDSAEAESCGLIPAFGGAHP